MKKSRYLKIATTILSMSLLFACSKESTDVSGMASEKSIKEMSNLISNKVTYDKDDYYTDWKKENPTYIELNGIKADYPSSAAILFSNNVLTIKTGGVYVLSGKMDDGQIVVDAEDKSKVRLVLNGVDISNSKSSAIHVVKSEKTTISLVDKTDNLMSDGETYVFADSSTDEPNAAIFSKDDLTINGTGKLTVTGNYNNGITSKDDLKITGGNILIKAVDDGLMGRDLVAINDGQFTIQVGGDGIKSTNDKDTSKGTIALEGGTFDITAGNDGIQAISSLLIANGSYSIKAGGGSPETIPINDERMGGSRGTNTVTTSTESDSAKGLKAAVELAIGGGTFSIDSLDDALHSNDSLTIAGGDIKIASGDDGIHADSAIVTTGGKIVITKSYEGIESKQITVEDGNIHLAASDDGINIGGGNDGSGMDFQSNAKEGKLQINGGNIYVDANGDGLDSNGSIAMTGGTVIVNGPTGNGNGSLDYDGSFVMNGGLLIAAGSSGMAQATSEQSTQSSLLMTYPQTQKAGTLVNLADENGKSIVTFAPSKDYQSVVISSPKLKKDETYTLFSGGTATGTNVDGYYSAGDYQKGTKVVEFKISDTVTYLNESRVTTGRTSGPGGQGGFGGGQDGSGGPGEFPNHDGMQPPSERGDMGGGKFSNLDEETMEKVKAIMEAEREGTITPEEAQTQMAELGIEMPEGRERP